MLSDTTKLLIDSEQRIQRHKAPIMALLAELTQDVGNVSPEAAKVVQEAIKRLNIPPTFCVCEIQHNGPDETPCPWCHGRARWGS